MKAIVAACAALLAPVVAHAQAAPSWSLDGRVGVVSDYRDRGYTLSDGAPSVQGEVTASHASGAYIGVWAAGIDAYGVGPDGDGATTEVTLYAGWSGEAGGFEVDLGAWGNLYPDGDDVDYIEFPLEIGRTVGPARFGAGVIWAPSQVGTGDEDNTYAWMRAEYAPETWPFALHAIVGYEDGGFAPDGKTDLRAGVEVPFGPVILTLDWVDSDTEDSAAVGGIFWTF